MGYNEVSWGEAEQRRTSSAEQHAPPQLATSVAFWCSIAQTAARMELVQIVTFKKVITQNMNSNNTFLKH